MDEALTTQLITVGATLGGVVLTLMGTAFVERRRAREAHRLESLRLVAEHAKWLREERMRAYAAYSLAGEDVVQFMRAGMDGLSGQAAMAERWRELRTDMRKAYNHVLLLGAEQPRLIALRGWRLARNGGNDLLRDLADGTTTPEEVPSRAKEIAALLGAEENHFLEACRADLQATEVAGPMP